MSILIAVPDRDTTILQETLKSQLPDEEIVLYKNVKDKNAVESLILWKHPQGIFNEFPHVKFASSLGAGVDHIMEDPSLPEELILTRIVDPELVVSMRKYLLAAVLNYHKNLISYYRCKEQKVWDATIQGEVSLKIGVMGLGQLGKDIATHLIALGFEVYGYSRTPKSINGVSCISGEHELGAFLSQINCLICLLPLTPQTEGILNLALFKQMQTPAYVINVGRGKHLVEEDLVKAFEQNLLKGACLDVFQQEPLATDHPFWTHPEIIITPHIASITNQKNAAVQFAQNFQRMKNGEPLINIVEQSRGY